MCGSRRPRTAGGVRAGRGRAAAVDADNTFPHEDLADLRAAGYLAAFVPEEFGGRGLSLAQITAEQTRLEELAAAREELREAERSLSAARLTESQARAALVAARDEVNTYEACVTRVTEVIERLETRRGV